MILFHHVQLYLHDAACQNNLDALKMLIIAGANINLRNKKGELPLDLIEDKAVHDEIESFMTNRQEDKVVASRSCFQP